MIATLIIESHVALFRHDFNHIHNNDNNNKTTTTTTTTATTTTTTNNNIINIIIKGHVALLQRELPPRRVPRREGQVRKREVGLSCCMRCL